MSTTKTFSLYFVLAKGFNTRLSSVAKVQRTWDRYLPILVQVLRILYEQIRIYGTRAKLKLCQKYVYVLKIVYFTCYFIFSPLFHLVSYNTANFLFKLWTFFYI